MKGIWKIARWPVYGLLILFALTLTFSAAIIKYAVNNYSEEYTGRRITVEDTRFNLLNGNIRLIGLNIKEADGQEDFINVKRLKLDMSIYEMWLGKFQLTSFTIVEPRVNIVQNGAQFNFDDLVEKFSSDTLNPDSNDLDETWYELSDLQIINGNIAYQSDIVHDDLIIEELDIRVDTLASYRSLINTAFEMNLDWGGKITGDLSIDQADSTYLVNIRSSGTDLEVFKVFITPYMNISRLSGDLNTDLMLSGNFNDNMGIALNGKFGVDDFALIDPKGNVLTSIEKFSLNIDSINVLDELYNMNSVVVENPFLQFEIYVEGDNFSNLLTYDSTEVSAEVLELGYDPSNPFSIMTHFAVEVANSYKDGSFRLDSVSLVHGELIYNDYSMYDVFSYRLTDLLITSHDINSKEKDFEVEISSILNEFGSLEAEIKFDPHSSRNMTIDYTIENVVMPNFGPYSLFYTALPILSGSTKYDCHTVIVDNQIESSNHIFIEDFQYGKKNKEIKDAQSLPLRFAVSLLKDSDGNIDIDIPIEGDLDDPDYKIGKVIWKMVKNLITKAVSAPFKMLANTFSVDEDDLKSVNFLYLQNDLTSQQIKPLNIISRVLESKPEMFVELIQSGNQDLEMQKYAVYMAKAQYYMDDRKMQIDPTDPAVQGQITAIQTNDSLFNAFLDTKLGPQQLDDPVQVKCENLIGKEVMRTGVDERWELRNNLMVNFLVNEKELDRSSFGVRNISAQDTIVSAGPPRYQVIYSMKKQL